MSGAELAASQATSKALRDERANRPHLELFPQEEPTMVDQQHETIANKVRGYNEAVREIRADASLSDKGKAAALQSAYDMYSGTVGAMAAEAQAQLDKRVNQLQRSVFGTKEYADDSHVRSMRDAYDRVEKARSAEDLAKLMNQAEARGDDTLLRAAAGVALQRSRDPIGSAGYGNLVEQYASTRPDHETKIRELVALTREDSPTRSFRKKMATSVSKPREIR